MDVKEEEYAVSEEPLVVIIDERLVFLFGERQHSGLLGTVEPDASSLFVPVEGRGRVRLEPGNPFRVRVNGVEELVTTRAVAPDFAAYIGPVTAPTPAADRDAASTPCRSCSGTRS